MENKTITRGDINFHLIDCIEFMKGKPDNHYELAIVDPPYGISINANIGLRKGQKKRHRPVKWDDQIPTDDYFSELFRVSQNQIIWGGNYFPLPPTKHVIFWDKLNPEGLSFSDGEIAWTSFNRAIRKYAKNNTQAGKIHATQKPIQLYRWLLQNYAKQGDKILDTHGGSMTCAIACDTEGFSLDICELDPDYFVAGVKAFDNYKQQLKLF